MNTLLALLMFANTNFSGLGPVFGMDATYKFNDYIAIVGHGSAAALIGDIDNTENITIKQTAGDVNFNLQGTNNTHLIPTVNGKLGLALSLPFRNTWNSVLTLEGGYQATEYFNVLYSMQPHIISRPTIGQSPLNVGRSISNDFAVDGPYISLTLQI